MFGTGARHPPGSSPSTVHNQTTFRLGRSAPNCDRVLMRCALDTWLLRSSHLTNMSDMLAGEGLARLHKTRAK